MKQRAPIVALVIVVAGTWLVTAQSPIQSCSAKPQPAWCSAVEGDRSEGWLSQHRSEVMGRNGMVAASQPLAAQAGLEVLAVALEHVRAVAVADGFAPGHESVQPRPHGLLQVAAGGAGPGDLANRGNGTGPRFQSHGRSRA